MMLNASGLNDRLDADLSALLAHLWECDVLSDAAVERAARQLLLDTIGSAISGLSSPEVQSLIAELSDDDPGNLQFLGSDRLLSRSSYLLAFSAAVCHFEAGEGLPVSHGRPGLHAVPVLLASAQQRGSTLRDILEALVIAYEVGGRLGAILRVRPGMHVDGTWGSFSSAVALARLEGLSWQQSLAAISHVACQVPFSLYYPIRMGSISRNFFIGHGALLGAAAVRAARTGYGGPTGSLSEFSRLALGVEPAGLLRELPPERRILLMGYLKQYPCTRHMHYGIEAAKTWFETSGRAAHPTKILLKTYAEAIKYCPNRSPRAHIQAQFSLSYGVAYTMLHGDFTPTAYLESSISDPELHKLESQITIEEDRELELNGKRGCTLIITSPGGEELIKIDRVTGDEGTRMTEENIKLKFTELVTSIIGPKSAQQLIDAILSGSLDIPLDMANVRPFSGATT